MSRIGIIGGSGLYQIEGISRLREEKIDTPFGPPSDALIIGELEGKEVVFLPRHGRGHRLSPSEVNYRANIYALKLLDVGAILSVSAVGSLRPDYKPTDMVIIDNFFDRCLLARPNTFFGEGIVAHVQMAHPLCDRLGRALLESGREIGAVTHAGGTYLNMEGPQFSTLAESQTYRKWGMDVIGMTQMSEARLAREAEICYATLAMVTDFDCWYEAESGHTVSVELVLSYMEKNIKTAKEMLRRTIARIDPEADCSCRHALAGAILTDCSYWPEETIRKLYPLIKNYL
ncbi:MAG: S-methyl-5'-thioadenosine phosphorylase [candidate division KSB1 bacterium]|nr:S-methyl-5'-thioadenosine phosphorylase [candidate division KSB1 bacterium]